MIAEVRACLGAELDRLSNELTERLEINPHASPDDRRKLAVSDLHRTLQREIRFLGQLVAGLAVVDPGTVSAGRVGYGSDVTIRDLTSQIEETYTLVAGDFIDLEDGHVSLASPLGHALISRKAGDRVVVTTPKGERRYEIVSVITLPQRLGIGGAGSVAMATSKSMQIT